MSPNHADGPDDTSLLVQCPKCLKTNWRGSTCNHGAIPAPDKDAPKEPESKAGGLESKRGKR